jgi:hypothetical protein
MAIENGRVTNPPISIYEYYQGAAWHEANSIPSGKERKEGKA